MYYEKVELFHTSGVSNFVKSTPLKKGTINWLFETKKKKLLTEIENR